MASAAPLVIVGGGLAGSLAALALAERRPDIPLLLLESGSGFGGDRIWSYFDSDVCPGMQSLVAALQPVTWPRHRVRFPNRDRVLDVAYNSVSAVALDALVRRKLAPEAIRLNVKAAQIDVDGVTLASGERIAASGVIDARGPTGTMPGLELGWQKFVGIEFAATAPQSDCAMVMDATVPQIDGYRFVYVLPFAPGRVLVEDTYYSDSPELAVETIANRVRELADERGLLGPELRRESGVLPILISGDPAVFWPKQDPIARLGLVGGFFHPATGYSFGLALQLADELSRLSGPLGSAQLADWTRRRFLRHWREAGFFRLLNQMLFRAGTPELRHRVLSHFYRLPPERIARFYSNKLNLADKARILSGRPPVPVGEAIKAMLRG